MTEQKTSIWRLPVDPREASISRELAEISRILSDGGLLVFPTDTVYGIGCDPFRGDSVHRLVRVKRRPPTKGMPVLASSIQAAARIAQFSRSARNFAEKVWPGSVTLILPILESGSMLPELVTGGESTVAVRVPGLPLTRHLAERSGGLLIGTSANLSGQAPVSHPDDLIQIFSGLVDGIVLGVDADGSTVIGSGVASTIIDLTAASPKVLRGDAKIIFQDGSGRSF